jgi:hypothetical protein
MAYRTIIVLAATAALGVASFSSDALAWRGGAGRVGVGRGGVGFHGGAWRGGVGHGVYAGRRWGPGWGVAAGVGAAAVGAAAIGAAATAPYYNNYYNSAACGYYPYPACY